MPKGQFYALAIFVMGRLDTKGVGLKLWGRRRACSQDYPIALDPLLLGEHKHDHDFLFSFPFENAKAMSPILELGCPNDESRRPINPFIWSDDRSVGRPCKGITLTTRW